jgi:hypothetical protein
MGFLGCAGLIHVSIMLELVKDINTKKQRYSITGRYRGIPDRNRPNQISMARLLTWLVLGVY